VIELEKPEEGTQIIIARPEKDKIEMALEKTGMSTHDLHCSICNKPITDLKQIRAIFPYHSALICCDSIECLIGCRNKLLAESNL
jgi:hypothetical protein